MNQKHNFQNRSMHRLLMLFCVLFSSMQFTFSQQQTVVGTVVDKTGEAIIGASVVLKGTAQGQTVGTITDLNGKFSISASTGSELLVSYIGMKAKTVTVVDEKPLYVNMDSGDQSLDEVVVIGYGSSTKRDLTGSMSKVNMDDIIKSPVPSITDALGGRVAGVSVTSPDGQPGATANIVIRGTNSLTGDNSPLYVIDGFPLENAQLNTTPPEDIESIDILKDASATAIYGARGANGVIIITTKKGAVGKPVVSYDGSYSVQQITKKMDLMTPYQYVKMYTEIQPADTLKYISPSKHIGLDFYKSIKGYDFQNAVFRQAPMQSHNIAVRGGTEATKYSASLNYLDQNGIIIYSGFKRLQGKFVLDQKINNVFTVGLNVGYAETNSYGVTPSEVGYRVETNVMTDVWGFRPVGNFGADISGGGFDPNDTSTDLRFNPYLNLKNAINTKRNDNLNSNGYLEVNFNTDLKLRVSGGLTQLLAKNSEFYSSNTKKGNPRNIDGVNGQVINLENSTWLNENILTYTKKVNADHKFILLAGETMQGYNSSSFGARAVNSPYESLGISGLEYATPQLITSNSSPWTMMSYLGRFNYDFKSKYMLTASFRSDGSSKFAAGNKWSYFPSGSFAWRINEEDYIKRNLSAISDFKLRTSYGVTGNNRVGDFASLSQMSGGYYYNGTNYNATYQSALSNPDLRWESTSQTNIGIDFGLFSQRITLTIDAYRKITDDLLLNSQMIPSTGWKTATKNIGSVQNQGLEIALNTINVRTKDFQWNTNFNISFNQNTVLDLADGQNSYASSPGSSFAPNLYAAIKGQSISQIVGYVSDGLYQYSDFDKTPAGTYVLKNNVTCNSASRTNIVQPGYVKLKDLNGDGIINTSDLAVIGNPLPKNIGGFTNTFNYKGLELSVFFQWSYGNDIYNGNRAIFESGSLTFQNVNHFASFDNRWSPDNQSGVFPIARGDLDPNVATSRCVEDGSFIRFKSASLGYYFDTKLLKKIGMSKLKFYVSALNLYTWTKYSGFDPEVSSLGNTLTSGFDFSTYPRAQTVTVGLNAAF